VPIPIDPKESTTVITAPVELANLNNGCTCVEDPLISKVGIFPPEVTRTP
jgi:hypothetical protein